MITTNISVHYDSQVPLMKLSNYGTFFILDFSSPNYHEYSKIYFFFQELKEVIEFKNRVPSGFNKLMKEEGYDR